MGGDHGKVSNGGGSRYRDHRRGHVGVEKSRSSHSPRRDRDQHRRHRENDRDRTPPVHGRSRSRRQSKTPERQMQAHSHSHNTSPTRVRRVEQRSENDRSRAEWNRKRIEQRVKREQPDEEDQKKFDWGKKVDSSAAETSASTEKQKPNFGLSGKLAADTNTFNGVVIKYNEPPEARKPKVRWRLYPFKGNEPLPVMYIHRQSAYLLGRDRRVADIPIDHPSCSSQHAVLQYRLVSLASGDDGRMLRRVCPYVIDLASANGTCLNNQRIEPQRYVQLKERDVLRFGFSSREYVLLHEHSAGAEADSDSAASGPGDDDDDISDSEHRQLNSASTPADGASATATRTTPPH